MKYHNYMEDIVRGILDSMLAQNSDICGCEKCKLDITALTLNNLTPKYVVNSKGRIYAKLSELELQKKTDAIKEMIMAIKIVKENPQH